MGRDLGRFMQRIHSRRSGSWPERDGMTIASRKPALISAATGARPSCWTPPGAATYPERTRGLCVR
jgi:hypothetical protein